MVLKSYQQRVLNELITFFNTAKAQKSAYEQLPENVKPAVNWVDMTFNTIGKTLIDKPKTGLGQFYPRFCVKVPTSGGKTLIAVESIREYQNIFAQKKTGLIVWMVPSETIYTQTIKKLKDKGHFYRQLLDQASGGHTLILEKGQVLKPQDIEGNLVVLFLMIQSVSRRTRENLRVFDDSGAYDSFFPKDNRYDAHKELLERIPNLDTFAGLETAFPQVKTSLGNVIRLTNPFIIVDEFHNVFSDTGPNPTLKP
jgi:type III restriction enzyme